MTRENRDDGFQSLRLVFAALTLFMREDLPSNFEEIKTVNVYEANGDEGDDWKAHLNDQGEAWVITPLHYTIGGSNKIRFASGGGRWDDRTGPLNKQVDPSWQKRKYKLVERTNKRHATNKRTGLPTYTMHEYIPNEDKPKHALCQITVDNENYAHSRPPSRSQQPKSMKIDHTDNNNSNGDKGETSLSDKSLQQGGNFENATRYCNPPLNLEMFFARIIQGGELSEFMKPFSKDYIVQVFSQKMDEIEIPDASPKEHSTEAAVRNPRKRRRCTDTNTMEADTSTQSKEQAKVEMFESNLYQEKPTNLRHDTNRNCSELKEQSGSHHEPNSPGGYCTTYHDTSYNLDDLPNLEENWDLLDNQVCEPNADLQEPNNLCQNFKANSSKPKENRNQLPIYDQNTNAPGPSTRNYAAIEGWLDHQMFEPNADVQVPNYLSHNFKAYYTKPTENMNHIPGYNQNIIAPGSSTSKDATTEPLIVDPSTYEDPLEEQLVPLCTIYDETCGWLNHQMFEENADVQGPNYLSNNFNAHSIEPTKINNHIPSYNQNIIAPTRSPSNDATTEPGNLLQNPYDTILSGGLGFHLPGNESIQDFWD